MKPILLAMTCSMSVFGLLAAPAARAESSAVYLCTDAQGHKEYKNTGITKGCKKVDLPAITTIPAPRKAAASAARSGEMAASEGGAFPKLDGANQKARDSDRRQILQDELRSETQKLEALKKEFNNGQPERRGNEANYAKYQERVAQMKEDINRIQQNVDALKRELANLK